MASEGLASVSTDLPKIALIVWFEKQTNETASQECSQHYNNYVSIKSNRA